MASVFHFLTCPCLFWSCVRSEQLSTATIEDKKKYEEEVMEEDIFRTKNRGNEEKASSTEVESFAFMASLYAYKNEEMNGKDEEKEDIE